jgi:hypothetical protein
LLARQVQALNEVILSHGSGGGRTLTKGEHPFNAQQFSQAPALIIVRSSRERFIGRCKPSVTRPALAKPSA